MGFIHSSADTNTSKLITEKKSETNQRFGMMDQKNEGEEEHRWKNNTQVPIAT